LVDQGLIFFTSELVNYAVVISVVDVVALENFHNLLISDTAALILVKKFERFAYVECLVTEKGLSEGFNLAVLV